MKNRLFYDRLHAGEALAERLSDYRNDPNAVVLALPRGGVPVAAAIGNFLGLPFDVFITRTLKAPCHSGCVLGAIAETGVIYIDQSAVCAQECLQRDLRAYIEREIDLEEAELARLRQVYRRTNALEDLAEQRVILVDEGISDGAAFFAAVDALRKLGVSSIIGAFPIASAKLVRDMQYKVDDLVVLIRAENLRTISDYYLILPDVTDSEAARLIATLQPQIPKDRSA